MGKSHSHPDVALKSLYCPSFDLLPYQRRFLMEIKTVLCPTDFSTLSERELQLAIRICQRFGAKLVVQHNVYSLPSYWMLRSGKWLETPLPYDKEEERQAELRLKKLL